VKISNKQNSFFSTRNQYFPHIPYVASKKHSLKKFKSYFYLSHMEYEGSIGFVSRKWKKFIADFHVWGLFMAKKHDLSEKKISVCPAPLPLEKFVSTLAQSLWKLESWNFGFRSLLGQLDVPYTYSEFWNFESLGYLPYKFRFSDRRTVQKFGGASQKTKKLWVSIDLQYVTSLQAPY
jgi:hypothetical protein